MKLEYLFINSEEHEAIEEYKLENVTPEIINIDNTDCFIIQYNKDGDNENSAKILSKIDKMIKESFSPIVLINESSQYYNKKLFPYINEFERKLRCFLYLKSAISGDQESKEVIQDLESKDFGTIFEILFTDQGFQTKVRKEINNKSRAYTKDEILNIINELDENTVWGKLIEGNTLNELKNNFLKIKDFRNDVMHAHNINTTKFLKAKRLFTKINQELENEIKKMKNEPVEHAVNSQFNLNLLEAIKNNNIITDYSFIGNNNLYDGIGSILENPKYLFTGNNELEAGSKVNISVEDIKNIIDPLRKLENKIHI